jgi:RNA polymerase sigma factor (TIGR02999 family)
MAGSGIRQCAFDLSGGIRCRINFCRRCSSQPYNVVMNDFTQVLAAIEEGDPSATEKLLPLIYDELRRYAAQKLAQEKSGQTLQATALVHEVFLRMVGAENVAKWNRRSHFFSAAAEAMRRILIDRAREKKSLRRGGNRNREKLSEIAPAIDVPSDDLLALDEALNRLEAIDMRKADLVKLRYFSGLTIPQAAEVLGVSAATADRDWSYARVWIHAELVKGEDQ